MFPDCVRCWRWAGSFGESSGEEPPETLTRPLKIPPSLHCGCMNQEGRKLEMRWNHFKDGSVSLQRTVAVCWSWKATNPDAGLTVGHLILFTAKRKAQNMWLTFGACSIITVSGASPLVSVAVAVVVKSPNSAAVKRYVPLTHTTSDRQLCYIA